jgi:endonuclease/exonuclease/phosphatase family metal-dependent hydrolase
MAVSLARNSATLAEALKDWDSVWPRGWLNTRMVRSKFLALIAALSCLVLHGASAQEGARILRVLTYNLHHGEGTDGKIDLERIAKVIQSAKPDLVALQEVDQKTQRAGGVDQLGRLGELTGFHTAYGRAMDYQGGGYGVAMLSRWPLQDSRVHPLPAPPGVEPRVVLEAVVAMGDDGSKVRFLVTHVDHKGDPTHRAQQVARIRELFPAPGPDALPAILAGDLNATPESAVMKSLLADWTDSAAGLPFLTSPSNPPRVKIDYVLHRPAEAWRVVETRALQEPLASDHLPVLAVLERR